MFGLFLFIFFYLPQQLIHHFGSFSNLEESRGAVREHRPPQIQMLIQRIQIVGWSCHTSTTTSSIWLSFVTIKLCCHQRDFRRFGFYFAKVKSFKVNKK